MQCIKPLECVLYSCWNVFALSYIKYHAVFFAATLKFIFYTILLLALGKS